MKDIELKEDRTQVYEIGYLLVPSIPEEKVTSEVTSLKGALSKKGAVFISEEAPELRTLAYEMTKKIGTANQRFDQGYFGWFKFDLPAKEIEGIKKSFEENAHMLRMLVITTIKEPTYLGKKSVVPTVEASPVSPDQISDVMKDAAVVAPVASIDEMDKSIDAMVKEA